MYNLANAELALGEVDKARELLENVIKIEPNHRDAHYNLGAIHVSTDHLREAIDEYARVIEIDPGDQSAYYNIAIVFVKQGRYDEAKEYLNKSIAHFGQTTKWGRAAQRLLDLILRMETAREDELKGLLDKVDQKPEDLLR